VKPEKTYQVQGDGVKIQVGEWTGAGPAVLCLHGLTANRVCFEIIAESLKGAYRVLAIDLRGRGLSDKPQTGYTLDTHCRDIKALLKDLGLSKITLMGHSLGAYICLAFSAGYPELTERIILLDGAAELSAEQWEKVGAGINPSVERLGKVWPSMEAYLAQARRAPFFDPWNQTLDDYYRYDAEDVPGGVSSRISPATIAEERKNLAQIKPSELYPLVKCPVLMVQAKKGMLAEDDLVLPDDALQRMLKAMPQAKHVSLPSIHHFSMVFQASPERDQAILEFLRTT
jgi:pimeloyl-ACP methyl ester carboxylesterase